MRAILSIVCCILTSKVLMAQIYTSDSTIIEIQSKSNFSVANYKDLDINIVVKARVANKRTFAYSYLRNGYRSTFGNCYFELSKYDTIAKEYQSITDLVLGNVHPPMDVTNRDQIYTYELEKTALKAGEQRTLVFNLLNFIPKLSTGKYSLKLFFRDGNKIGYDNRGKIIANSLHYLESGMMYFEVTQDIQTPIDFSYSLEKVNQTRSDAIVNGL